MSWKRDMGRRRRKRRETPPGPTTLAVKRPNLAVRTAEFVADDPWLRLVGVVVSVAMGLLLVLAANDLARHSATSPETFFWVGLVVMFAPAVGVLLSPAVTRNESLAVVLIVAFGLYCVKLFHAPIAFTAYDELLHYRTLDDITRTGRLFLHNPLLPVSPYYPGLELVTTMMRNATGLDLFTSARVVIGIARALLVLSLFLFLENVTSSTRLAALGTLLYAAEPTYLYFDSQFAYESLAVPLAVFCLFLLHRALSQERAGRNLLEVLGFAAAAGVVVTHHVTWFILTVALAGWTLIALVIRRKRPEPIPGHGWVAPAVALAGVAWIFMVARVTVGYLGPHIVSSFRELVSLIGREGGGRRLFQTTSGKVAPLLERVVGLGAQGLIALLMAFALWAIRKRRRDSILVFLVIGMLAYPGVTALRLTWHGGEIARRAAAFLFVPLVFALAIGAAQTQVWGRRLRHHPPRGLRWARRLPVNAILVVMLAAIFAGGVIAGTAPPERLPRPYKAGSWQVSVADQGAAAAMWTREHLGLGNRFATDSVNTALLGSYGGQRILTGDDGVSTCELFLETPWSDHQRKIIGRNDVQYMLTDRRIAGTIPDSGYFYQKWERDVIFFGSTVPTATLAQLDTVPEASRVYDSGDVQLYDVRRLGLR